MQIISLYICFDREDTFSRMSKNVRGRNRSENQRRPRRRLRAQRFIFRAKLTTIISGAVSRGRSFSEDFPAVFFHQRSYGRRRKRENEVAVLDLVRVSQPGLLRVFAISTRVKAIFNDELVTRYMSGGGGCGASVKGKLPRPSTSARRTRRRRSL